MVDIELIRLNNILVNIMGYCNRVGVKGQFKDSGDVSDIIEMRFERFGVVTVYFLSVSWLRIPNCNTSFIEDNIIAEINKLPEDV